MSDAFDTLTYQVINKSRANSFDYEFISLRTPFVFNSLVIQRVAQHTPHRCDGCLFSNLSACYLSEFIPAVACRDSIFELV